MSGMGFSANQNGSGIITVTNTAAAYDSVQGVFTFPRAVKGYLLYANQVAGTAGFFRVGTTQAGLAAGTDCVQIPQPGFISVDMLALPAGTTIFFGHAGLAAVIVRFSILYW